MHSPPVRVLHPLSIAPRWRGGRGVRHDADDSHERPGHAAGCRSQIRGGRGGRSRVPGARPAALHLHGAGAPARAPAAGAVRDGAVRGAHHLRPRHRARDRAARLRAAGRRAPAPPGAAHLTYPPGLGRLVGRNLRRVGIQRRPARAPARRGDLAKASTRSQTRRVRSAADSRARVSTPQAAAHTNR